MRRQSEISHAISCQVKFENIFGDAVPLDASVRRCAPPVADRVCLHPELAILRHEHACTLEQQAFAWVTDTTLPNGCANTGHLVAASNLTPNVDVQASFNNDSAIANYLSGFFGATIPQLQFGEAAINLSTVLGDLGNPCGAFHSTWMHSRASLSDSSQLKDFVAPQPFHVSTCKASPGGDFVGVGQGESEGARQASPAAPPEADEIFDDLGHGDPERGRRPDWDDHVQALRPEQQRLLRHAGVHISVDGGG